MTDIYTVYKSDISYFSGKLEAYLRYKEIPDKRVDCDLSWASVINLQKGMVHYFSTFCHYR